MRLCICIVYYFICIRKKSPQRIFEKVTFAYIIAFVPWGSVLYGGNTNMLFDVFCMCIVQSVVYTKRKRRPAPTKMVWSTIYSRHHFHNHRAVYVIWHRKSDGTPTHKNICIASKYKTIQNKIYTMWWHFCIRRVECRIISVCIWGKLCIAPSYEKRARQEKLCSCVPIE